MKQTKVKTHIRKGRLVKRHTRRIPQSVGTLWHGERFIHGPRQRPPKDFKRMWISNKQWTKEKYLNNEDIASIRRYAHLHRLKLKPTFPKNIKVKVGITTKNKLKAQSFMTPLKR